MAATPVPSDLDSLLIEHQEDTKTVSKQARPSLFRFDTGGIATMETALAKPFRGSGMSLGAGCPREAGGFNMDDRQVLVYIRFGAKSFPI